MSELKTDYVNDELAISMGGKRRYRMIENSDGTVSFEDVTSYSVVGDEYDADDINSQNETINQLNNDLTANSQKFEAGYQNGKYGFTINNTFYEIGGGGMPLLDFANPIKKFTSADTTYTVPRDCYLTGVFLGQDNGISGIDVDGNPLCKWYNNTQCSLSQYIPPIKIKSGSVITLTRMSTTANYSNVGLYSAIDE